MATTARQFRRIQTTNKELNLIQDQLQDLFKLIFTNPWIFGKPLPQVVFVSGTNQVQHGLGRNFVSFFAAVPNTPAMFGGPSISIASAQQDRANYVTVVATGPMVCDCYVF